MSEVNETALERSKKRSKRSDAKQDLLLSDTAQDLLQQYGCGPIQFSGTNDALYERHLLFDDIVAPAAAGAREQFEAAARSARDILSQRWVRTQSTYDRENPKRVYYLSMEFLIGRSLTNNITNLLLDPFVKRAAEQKNLDWLGLIEQEPDAGLGNGGLGRLAACFLDSMATMQLPPMGYGLRYEYGMFKQAIQDGWQQEQPDNWLRRQDPWEVARPNETVEVKLNCSVELHGGCLHPVPDRPSVLIGTPFDRPVVGYDGKAINMLRLWAAAAPDYFDFQEFSRGDFVEALAGTLAAGNLTRVLYPDDSMDGRARRFSTSPAPESSPATARSPSTRPRSGMQNPARCHRKDRTHDHFTLGRQAGAKGNADRSGPARMRLFRAPA
jgi:glycogen phosphorylase